MNNRGASLLFLVSIIAVVFLIGQQAVLLQQHNAMKGTFYSQVAEGRVHLLNQLDELLSQEITIRNSRFNTNPLLHQCLKAIPSPCDERLVYDMSLYAPNPPVTYSGGPWPTPPTGIVQIAGGLDSNKVFYNSSGGRCPTGVTELSRQCPMQAIVEFTPLCGGLPVTPTLLAPGGAACTGPATGFEIVVGVAILLNENRVYHRNIGLGGDAIRFQISSLTLNN